MLGLGSCAIAEVDLAAAGRSNLTQGSRLVIVSGRCRFPASRWLVSFILSGILGATGAPKSCVAQTTRQPEQTVLRPGDLVRVTVWRKPELSGDFLVASDSTLKHPLYREVKLAGLMIGAARERLVEFLRSFENSPQVAIEPLFRVAVGGEVRVPNLYTLSPETSIAQAVALAGGPTERGQLDRIRLLRDGRELIVDLNSATSEATRASVASGDQIIIPRQRRFFRDYGIPILQAAGAVAAISNLFYRR